VKRDGSSSAAPQASTPLPPLAPDDIADVTCEAAASLWAGMGAVFEISVTHKSEKPPLRFMAKRVQLLAKCCSAGDQRKKDSYAVEAAFYSQGHAHRLITAGACVPYPLHIDTSRSSGVTICMTRLDGCSGCPGDSAACDLACVSWLATLHALYWGQARADAAVASGLQAQGCGV
jgi:hypothetical protein